MPDTTHSVYVAGDLGRHFHAQPSCWRIAQGRGRKSPSPVIEVALGDIRPRQSPCRSCYPDAPRVRARTPYCHTCDSALPCSHNGGVLVRVPRVWRYGSRNLIDAGEITYATRYVWPTRASRYELVG